MKYFGNWKTFDQMISDWGAVSKHPIPSDDDILLASYGSENYEGDAFVLFTHGGKLYEVNGSHCSCYGLAECSYSSDSESQWSPEETSWEALKMRRSIIDGDQHSSEAIETLDKLIATAPTNR